MKGQAISLDGESAVEARGGLGQPVVAITPASFSQRFSYPSASGVERLGHQAMHPPAASCLRVRWSTGTTWSLGPATPGSGHARSVDTPVTNAEWIGGRV